MSPSRPSLLVSVRDAAEALEALAGGAEWIDLKEPQRGALGAVDALTAREIVASVGGRAPLSAAAGELRDWPDSASAQLLAVSELRLLKLGLAGCEGAQWRDQWRAAQRQIADAGKHLVAVIYADHAAAAAPPPAEILSLAADAGSPWVLWDTYNKATGPIDEHLNLGALTEMLAAARAAGLRTVVAGRIDAARLMLLPLTEIDMIAVRGAACRSSRESPVCRRRVAALYDLLARHDDCWGAPLPSSSS
jgi:(5-formylfuran-3-yl)methyl phosphate synthase